MVKVGRRLEHAEDTRNAVLDAAELLFTDPGYAVATLDQVAASARVTKGAVYHHFDNKRALFRAVVERLFQRLVGDLSAAADERRTKQGDLWDAVCATYQTRLDLVAADPAYQRIVDQDAVAILGHEELIRLAQGTVNAALMPVLAEAIHDGLIKPLDPTAVAKLLGSLISAAGREIASAADQPHARRQLGQALDALLQGLRR